MLKIDQLSKTYQGNGKRSQETKKAVDNVSLEIFPGDCCGFIGHNGAGKTTTIKCITTILNYEQGEIYVNGLSVKKNPMEVKRQIAYIPDNPDLYENLTGIQYLNFIADVFKLSSKERTFEISKYAELFDFTANLGDLISSYSHGMKQKLALISALMHHPKLMILDEPFVGLDPKAAHTLKVIMKEICDGGGTIFFSTHVLEVAEKICNKIAIIKEGQLIKFGETESVIGDQSLEQLFLELIER